MDPFDLKILDIVQRNNRQATEMVAEQIGLSPSAVQRRLKRLREQGIIEADVSVISPEAAGRNLTAIIEVMLQTERPLSQPMEELKELMLARPEVMQCYHVTGEADLILIVTARNMQEYETFTRDVFVDNPNVRRYRTSIVISRIKAGSMIPLLPDQLASSS
jgi:Lrp/AsnC family transcriptional regulator, leucine-responsive regulatory protein